MFNFLSGLIIEHKIEACRMPSDVMEIRGKIIDIVFLSGSEMMCAARIL